MIYFIKPEIFFCHLGGTQKKILDILAGIRKKKMEIFKFSPIPSPPPSPLPLINNERSLMCGIIMFRRSYSDVAHGFSKIGFATGTIAFVYDMGWVRVFVIEFE